jgi:HD-GYP domain-containing protein (c-di-GMP phosphodiesterase class II)
MMFDRPYRKAMTQESAFAELIGHSGTQFDSDAVAALIALERGCSAVASEPAEALA